MLAVILVIIVIICLVFLISKLLNHLTKNSISSQEGNPEYQDNTEETNLLNENNSIQRSSQFRNEGESQSLTRTSAATEIDRNLF